jgi:acyl-CoA hydrolase
MVPGMLRCWNMSTPGRPVRDSHAEYTEVALASHENPLGNLLGGRIMHLVDLCASISAMRIARKAVVTASVDYMTFLHPVHIGELLVLRSSVNRVFNTSMEVGVKVWKESLTTGEIQHVNSAYLTFVALDQQGKRVPVGTDVVPETDEEKMRWEEAARRREERLKQRDRARKHG